MSERSTEGFRMNLREIGEDFVRALKLVFGLPLTTLADSRRLRKELKAQEDHAHR